LSTVYGRISGKLPSHLSDDCHCHGITGVIYVRSYVQGEGVAEEMDCPFTRLLLRTSQELLEQWARGSGGMDRSATGALGTGIDIPGVVYISISAGRTG